MSQLSKIPKERVMLAVRVLNREAEQHRRETPGYAGEIQEVADAILRYISNPVKDPEHLALIAAGIGLEHGYSDAMGSCSPDLLKTADEVVEAAHLELRKEA